MSIDQAVIILRKFYRNEKRLPSYSELGKLLGVRSKSNSFSWADKLIKAGIIGKDTKGKLFPRNLFSIPNLGMIKAGYPSPAGSPGEHDLDPFNFIMSLPSNPYVLTVSGDSMKDAFINEGDIAVIDPDAKAKVGDIVAALVDGEPTLKYLSKKGSNYFLHPANPRYPDIPLTSTSLIQGVLKKVLRDY